jgi:PAP2 superfamily
MHTLPANVPDSPDTAWRFFLFNWIVVGTMTATLVVAAPVFNFSIGFVGIAVAVGYVGIYAYFAHANARSPKRRDPQVMFVLGATAQLVLITAVMAPMTYVAAAIDLPMQDATLLAMDRALGLDWAAYVKFVDAHPTLASWLNVGYAMIGWPLFAIPVFLAAKRSYQRIEEFTFAFAVALAATTIISALVPAVGVYQEIGLDPGALKSIDPGAYLDQLRDLPPTRAGVLRHLELLGLGGIVTFPSFHAAAAVLYTWALWVVRWMRPVALLANGAMLAATPLNGGHYFVDVIAGMAIAALAIVAAHYVGQAIARRQGARAAGAPVPAVAPAL